MIRLSDQIGRWVWAGDGSTVGRVADMSLRLGPAHPRVSRLLVRRGRSAHLVRWDDVHLVSTTRLALRPGTDLAAGAVDPLHPALDPIELLLARDVLDTQVIDLRGRHLSRVSDVLLDRRGDDLAVVAVDLGMMGLLRRLGLAPLLPSGAGVRPVDWQDLHLTSPRGHGVQLSVDAAAFRRLDNRGLAELLARLSISRAADVVRALDPAQAAAAIHESHPHTGRRIVSALDRDERSGLVAGATEEHARTLVRLGEQDSPLRRRRYLRTKGWHLRRPPDPGPDR